MKENEVGKRKGRAKKGGRAIRSRERILLGMNQLESPMGNPGG